MKYVLILIALIVTLVGSGVAPDPVVAAFPGKNGRIVFVSLRDGDTEIYTMKKDGSDVRQLTTNTVADTAPAWSADGTMIVFESFRDGNFEIYTMYAMVAVRPGSRTTRRSMSNLPGRRMANRSPAPATATELTTRSTL